MIVCSTIFHWKHAGFAAVEFFCLELKLFDKDGQSEEASQNRLENDVKRGSFCRLCFSIF